MILRMSYHNPVLLHECTRQLQLRPGGTYVDTTLGGGGHSRHILQHLEGGRLLGFDQDPEAAANAPDDPRFTLVQANFRHLRKMLRLHDIKQVDGILADFGISSHQIDEPARGFSIRFDGPLDMRMNPDLKRSAREVVNHYSHKELIRLFRDFGELPRPHLLASAVEQHRPLETTAALKEALQRYAPRQHEGRFWARVFQALRIEVNEEIRAIEELLEQVPELLSPGGRMVCLSYHSLEDRPVKNFFRFGNVAGQPQKDFYGNLQRPMRPLQRKPLVAGAEEIAQNPRARSAKLRSAEKIDENAH